VVELDLPIRTGAYYIPKLIFSHDFPIKVGDTYYTLCFKKTAPFYFCNNFVDSGLIRIIFGRNVANEFFNLLTLTYLLLYLTTGNQLKCC